jgi:thioredoxin 2
MKTSTVLCENCGRRNRIPVAAEGVPKCGNCGAPLPWIVDAGDDDFAEIAERASIPVLVDMWASWCGPCRMVSPALEQLAREYAGRIKLVKVDIEKAPRLSRRFTIQAVPTLMVLRHGEMVSRQAGAAAVPVLRGWLEHAIGADSAEQGPERRKEA